MSISTLWQLLKNSMPDIHIPEGIVIPIIQRDYAQGRTNNKAAEIRKVFIHKIKSSIRQTIHCQARPLEFDFIYGNIENDAFIPLDGQQRLTTLFLLHWYFAFKEQLLSTYASTFSRFKYATRRSSGDFFRHIIHDLNKNDHDKIFNKHQDFHQVLADKSWYFLHWKHDVTIQGIVTMLNEIHHAFSAETISFEQLTSLNQPLIVFHILDIRSMGLSDDLYIKMNARGRPLTSFENLKAELGRLIEFADWNKKYNNYSIDNTVVSLDMYFATKVDTTWIDYFWKIRATETNVFDDKMLNLLAFVALNEIAKISPDEFNDSIHKLEPIKDEVSFYTLSNLSLLQEETIIAYITTLDLLTSDSTLIKNYLANTDGISKSTCIQAAFSNNFAARYAERLYFYAITRMAIEKQYFINESELKYWDRLIKNLVTYTTYNDAKDFQASLLSITQIIEQYNGEIYTQFEQSDIKGFDTQQILEEKLKIALIQRSDKWATLINKAENHGYLDGQLAFLLSFSGIKEYYVNQQLNEASIAACYTQAAHYYHLFIQLFSNDGLIDFKEELFRRALLAKGDYLLYSINWSFLINRDRDISWKRLLRDQWSKPLQDSNPLYALFTTLDIHNISGSMQQIIDTHQVTDWRKDFIEHPILLSMCKQHRIKFYNDNNIYLLRNKKYFYREDPEVKSVLIQQNLLAAGFIEEEIGMGYIDELKQYGITHIRDKQIKIAYLNNDGVHFLIRQDDQPDDIRMHTREEVENEILKRTMH
ncbi:DUF262 domain-containing protein [Chitinophaga sp. HK235]|uniref:DUF262 domain-containing protein n=1 Tax=Chitinophaga sp. HK235 TaxID=2952571 RepID=UPI001BABE907|nr:DUF262 domain-containing protein [Chitinophaga sp. HK235]